LIVLVGPKGRATQFFTLTFHYLVGGWLARLARFSKLSAAAKKARLQPIVLQSDF
jgi:hypothetical protein